MAGSFRDSFTKEDTKEDVLGYDDTAFHYFAVTVLTCLAVPWTVSVVHNVLYPGSAKVEKAFPARHATSGLQVRHPKTCAMVDKVDAARQEARRCTSGVRFAWAARVLILGTMWVFIIWSSTQWLGDEKDIKKFDPFTILEVDAQASNVQIKRSYRKLSLVYHPDKNPDDPLAQSRFIMITKAYQALTDDVARRNWEKFGNPDGPASTKVGIGLPRLLLEKANHMKILFVFFFILLFVVPMTFICYYQQTKNFAANGVMIETLQFLGYYINERTMVKNCPELLAACAESRGMQTRPTDNAALKAFGTLVQEHKKRVFTLPVVMKNQYLVWAHMQRHHKLMTPELRADVDEILGYSMRITQAMIEIACMREWFVTTQALIEFRRCLVQALDVKSHQLLQVPHMGEEQVARFIAASPPVNTLAEFLALESDRRKELLKIDDVQQLADVDAFCSHVGEIQFTAKVEVEDEAEFVVGDVATVVVRMVRKNLREGEAMGAVHAPFFPEAKYEEWWFFLVDAEKKEPSEKEKKESSQARIVHFERVTDVERGVEQQLRFQVTKPGENKFVLHCLCDSYYGLDHTVELSFTAHAEDAFKRDYKIHQEDEELDLNQTLFQQFLGDGGDGDEESEEEEEEDGEEGHSDAAPSSSPSGKKSQVGERTSPKEAAGGSRQANGPEKDRGDAAKVKEVEGDESSGSSSDESG